MNRISSKFETVAAIRHTLINEFESCTQTLMILTLGIGYFEGQTKIWLVTSDDINSMYSNGVMVGCLRVIVKRHENKNMMKVE